MRLLRPTSHSDPVSSLPIKPKVKRLGTYTNGPSDSGVGRSLISLPSKSCHLSPQSLARGSSKDFDACRQSLRDHQKAVFSLHGSLSPCLDAKKIRSADVSPSVRVGALGAEAACLPYNRTRSTAAELREGSAVAMRSPAASPRPHISIPPLKGHLLPSLRLEV
jgi:hypothetical protein